MLSAFGTQLDPPNPPIVIDELNIWSVTGVPSADTSSAATDTIATITDFIDPPSAQQKNGSGNKIYTADSRLLDAVYRDGLLWGSGNDSCLPTGDTLDRSCLQYFEVLTGGASPVVNQDFSFGTKNAYDYYPSVDLDSSDDLISSFSQSSSTEFPSAYVDGRLLGDPVNTLGTPVLFQAGAQTYNGSSWGDYSGAGVDPSDQTSIWVAAEYATNASTGLNWGTSIAEARSPRRLICQPDSDRHRDADCHRNANHHSHCHDYRNCDRHEQRDTDHFRDANSIQQPDRERVRNCQLQPRPSPPPRRQPRRRPRERQPRPAPRLQLRRRLRLRRRRRRSER